MNSAAQIKNTNSRNTTIDAIKAIAAINVVFLHYNHVGGGIGEAYSRIIFNFTTFAVPFFFMVTGYYMIPLIQKEREILPVEDSWAGVMQYCFLFCIQSADGYG